MPRKKAEVKTEAKESLEDLTLKATLNALETKFGKGAIILAGMNNTMDVPRIPFGHPDLDEMTNGGLPCGKITVLIGEPGGGKSTAALSAIAQAQKMGKRAAFIDSEFALDPEYAASLGVDVDSLLVSQPQSAEQALEIFDALVRSNAVGIVVLDSVSATSTNAEIEGAMSDQQRGDKARLFSKAMRKLGKPVSDTKTAAVFINQWRDDAGGYGGGKQMPAGKALKFHSSLILDFARKETLYKTKAGDKVPTGQISVVKSLKSRVSLPFQKREIELKYPDREKDGKIIPGSGGFNIYSSIIAHALDDGRLVLKGSWYQDADGNKLAQGKDKMVALMQNDESLLERLK